MLKELQGTLGRFIKEMWGDIIPHLFHGDIFAYQSDDEKIVNIRKNPKKTIDLACKKRLVYRFSMIYTLQGYGILTSIIVNVSYLGLRNTIRKSFQVYYAYCGSC